MKKSFLLLKLSFLFTNASYAMDESEAWKDKHGIKDNPVAVVADNNNHNSQVMKLDQFDMFTIDKINQFLDAETFTKFAALNKKMHRYSLPRKLTIKCNILSENCKQNEQKITQTYENKLNINRYKHIENIKFLDVNSSPYLLSINHNDYLPKFTDLDLSSNKLENESIQYLTQANFPNLTKLDLSKNMIVDEGIKYLAQANLHNLTSLDLSSNFMGIQGDKSIILFNPKGIDSLSYLAEVSFPNLTSLDLHRNKMQKKDIEYLAQANLPNLTSLNLNTNKIKDEDAEYVKYLLQSKFPKLTNLELNLEYNE